MTDWTVAPLIAHTKYGPHEIPAWIKPPFALDFRTYLTGEDFNPDRECGWCLSHIATGYAVCGILAPIAEAKVIADRFGALADWNFEAPEAAKKNWAALAPLREELDDKLLFSGMSLSPLYEVDGK